MAYVARCEKRPIGMNFNRFMQVIKSSGKPAGLAMTCVIFSYPCPRLIKAI